MNALEAYAKENSLPKLKLHAQTHAEDFYKKLGYVTNSDVFMEANIPHIVMIKKFENRRYPSCFYIAIFLPLKLNVDAIVLKVNI